MNVRRPDMNCRPDVSLLVHAWFSLVVCSLSIWTEFNTSWAFEGRKSPLEAHVHMLKIWSYYFWAALRGFWGSVVTLKLHVPMLGTLLVEVWGLCVHFGDCLEDCKWLKGLWRFGAVTLKGIGRLDAAPKPPFCLHSWKWVIFEVSWRALQCFRSLLYMWHDNPHCNTPHLLKAKKFKF